MKTPNYKLILLAAISLSGSVLLNSCSKSDDMSALATTNQAHATSNGGIGIIPADRVAPTTTTGNLFDQTLMVSSAKTASGEDLTAQFKGYTFQFASSKEGGGLSTATSGRTTVYGKWTNGEQSGMNFNFPTDELPDLAFMNKGWMSDNSGSTTGTSDAPGLNFVSSNGDVLHFASASANGPR